MSIAVIGSIGLDTIDSPFGKAERVLGGSASYFSVAASLFTPVNLIGIVGKDFPSQSIEMFQRKNIGVKGLSQALGKTFSWSGCYNQSLQDPRTLSVDLGVFAGFKPKVPAQCRKSRYIFLANIDPKLQIEALKKLKSKRSQIVACDTMNFWIENKKKELLSLLRQVDLFFLNQSEAQQLTGQTHLLKAARSILKLGPKKVFIKRGDSGVMLVTEKSMFITPAYPTDSVVDPTGAGDTFAGATIGFLASIKNQGFSSLKKAAVYGVVAASFTVEGFSLDVLKKINFSKLKARASRFRKFTSF